MSTLAQLFGLEDENGFHYHQCDKCKSVWSHPTPPEGADREYHHTCPKCGVQQYWKAEISTLPHDESGNIQVDYPFTGWKAATGAVAAMRVIVEIAVSCLTAQWRK